MLRTSAVFALIPLVALTACERQAPVFDPPNPDLWAPWPEHERAQMQAALPVPVRGQALIRDRVVVGLDGGTAELNPDDKLVGQVIHTTNTNREFVQSARIEQTHLQVATINDLDVRVVDIEAGGFLTPIFVGDTPRAASFLTDGRLVVLVERPEHCEVNFIHDDVQFDLPACPLVLSMRPVDDTGVVIALGSAGVFHVTLGGSTLVHDDGNLVDWNPVAEHFIVASLARQGVDAVDLDGQPVWTRTTVGALQALSNLGATDELLWAEVSGDGSTMVWGAGVDQEIARMEHDEPVIHIASNETGTRIGVARVRDYANYLLSE
jgi:hypothetical protein